MTSTTPPDEQPRVFQKFYRLDPDFSVHKVDSRYICANGPTFRPDGKIVYHTDSNAREIYRFDVQGDGSLANKRVFARFDGIGFAINANTRDDDGKDHVPQVELHVDGKHVETVKLPSNQNGRRFVAFWRYQLPKGKHTVRLKLANPAEGGVVALDYAILYSDTPSRPQY